MRAPPHHANITALTCAAFADPSPRALQTWHIFTRHRLMQARCESTRTQMEFRRKEFAADTRIR